MGGNIFVFLKLGVQKKPFYCEQYVINPMHQHKVTYNFATNECSLFLKDLSHLLN